MKPTKIINENYNHVFSHATFDGEKFQRDYVVFDVETQETKISATQKKLTFKLISYIFVEDFVVMKKDVTDDLDMFWNAFYRFVKDKDEVICINNNIGFDIRASRTFEYLESFKYYLSDRFYLKGRTLILSFERKEGEEKHKILFLDMQNYFPYKSVKQFGKAVGLEKLEIDFDTCSMKELKIYAVRDVEIVWTFFKQFIDFLLDNELVSRLKPTIASLSLEAYRTKFHKNVELFIHNWITAIRLEHASYRGGISDVFLKDVPVECYYIDINSMYPHAMKTIALPSRLIASIFEASHSQEDLFSLLQLCIDTELHGCIAKITYSLHEGYILNKHEEITCNVHGDFLEGSFCQPELEYILEHGSIKAIHQLNVYEMEFLFDEYVDFFYAIKKVTKGVVKGFTKSFLNNLYGKWGQLKEIIRMFKKSDIARFLPILEDNKKIIFSDVPFCHVATVVGEGEIYKIGKKLYLQERLKTKAFDSFIAISSFITSACRVYLMKLKEIAEPRGEFNVFYVDTDSLHVNEQGLQYLKDAKLIGKELGQLDFEMEGKHVGLFHAPKDYEFGSKTKCKGIKKKSKKLSETTFEIEEFESLNKAIKKNHLDGVIITKRVKTMSREYKKGIVLPSGKVIPFEVKTC